MVNVEDSTSATDRITKRYVDTKTSNYLKTDGRGVMTVNFEYEEQKYDQCQTGSGT